MRPSLSAAIGSQNPVVVRSPAKTDGVSRWIASPQYSLSTIQGEVFLNPFEPHLVAESFASDCLRLSFAGRETLQTVRAIRAANATHAAWSAIQIYYSAFYYASAFLRLIGVSNSYFYSHELISLRAIATAQSINSIPAKGLFNLSLNTTSTQIQIDAVGKSGSHEALWSEFRRQIALIKNSTSNNPEFSAKDVLQSTSDFEHLENASKGIGNTHNLSSVRNDVQYRQKLSCWHPNLRDVKKFHLTDRIGIAFNHDFDPVGIMQHDLEYSDFFTKCLMISAFCHKFLTALSETANKGTAPYNYSRYHNANI